MAKQDLYTAPRKVVATNVIDNEPSAEEKLKGVEHWYQNNSKLINNVLIGILAVVAGIFAYTRFYKAPKIQKSNDAIFRAQTYFGIDSINWALNGDGSNLGFLKIIDKYSGTPAANLSQYYAGICYLKMGDFAKDAHYNLGKVVKENGVDLLITAGENMKYLAQGAKDNGVENIVSFDKTLEVCNYVKDEIKSGDAVLIKASRGMHFEEVYNTIKNK